MLFLNLLILLGVSSGVLSNEDAKCNPLLDEADKCFTKILFLGDYNAKPVTDEVQMTQHCNTVTTSRECVLRWGKCLTPASGVLFDYLNAGIKRLVDNRCSLPDGKREFMESNKCLTDPVHKLANQCIDRIVVLLNYLAEIDKTGSDVSHDVYSMCCYLSFTINCVRDVARKNCGAQSEALANYILIQARGLLGGIGKYLCKRVEDYSECETKHPNIVKEINARVGPGVEVPVPTTGPLWPFIRCVAKILDKNFTIPTNIPVAIR